MRSVSQARERLQRLLVEHGVQIERHAADRDTPAQREQRGAAVLHLIGSGMVPGGR